MFVSCTSSKMGYHCYTYGKMRNSDMSIDIFLRDSRSSITWGRFSLVLPMCFLRGCGDAN